RKHRGLKTVVTVAAALLLIACVPAGIVIRSRLHTPRAPLQPAEREVAADSTDLDPWQGPWASDKIQQLIDRGRLLVEQTEGDIARQDDSDAPDSISRRGSLLMSQAQALARAIQTGGSDPSDQELPIPNRSFPNRR